MSKLLFALIFSLAGLTTQAQKVYFIYIQSESDQPFFVKLDDKVYSSTSSGYLLLSRLRDTVYNFSVGFPQNKWPEHKFSVTINRKDHGYLLKNFGDKGWGLYNLQTLAIQMGTSNAVNNSSGKTDNKDISPFTEILSKAADDPSLKEKPAKPVTEEKKPVIEPVIVKKEIVDTAKVEPVVTKSDEKLPREPESTEEKKSTEPVVIKSPDVIAEKKTEPEVKVSNESYAGGTSYKPSVIKKWSESSTTEGFGLVYIDEDFTGQKDTIRLLIPNPKNADVPVIKKGDDKKEEKQFIEIVDTTNKTEEKTISLNPVMEEKIKEKPSANNFPKKCEENAGEPDFFELRKQMAAAENDDDMITLAKKYFKKKCFSTMQIKNLSFLFLSDQGKYNFFDAAYNNVTDPAIFGSLQSEIKDQYYANRFKAMLRN
jgi:hypothetical protein